MKALKKHGGLEEEVGSYQSVVTALQKQAESLVSGDHFDSSNITARQVHIVQIQVRNRLGVSISITYDLLKVLY